MKKTLLLAGVACLISATAAHAMDYTNIKPIIGLDYAYDNAEFKKESKGLNDDFNSGIISLGTRIGDYSSVEAFYQLAGEKKTSTDVAKYKAKFSAYGLDVYGHLPLGCEQKVELLGSLGLGIYDIDIKRDGGKVVDTNRVGYRIGLGAQYNFTPNVAGRIMGRYDYIGNGQLHSMNEVTAGIRYAF